MEEIEISPSTRGFSIRHRTCRNPNVLQKSKSVFLDPGMLSLGLRFLNSATTTMQDKASCPHHRVGGRPLHID